MTSLRRVLPLLVLALAAVAVLFWPRPSQAPEGTKDGLEPRGATTPKLAAARPAGTPTPPPTETPSSGPYRFHVVGDAGPLADVIVRTTEDGKVLGNTDSEGRLAIEDAESDFLAVEARKKGYVAASAHALRGQPCEIRLPKSSVIAGRVVVAPDDRPVEGATVTVGLGFGIAFGAAPTDANGAFRVDDVPSDQPMTLVARAPGHTLTTGEARAGDAVLLRFTDGGVLEGVVADERGTPIPNALVLLLAPDAPLPGDPSRGTGDASSSWRDEIDRTVTDAVGRYEVAGVEVGTTRVAVAFATSTLFARSAPVKFEHAGERARRDVVVPAGGGILVSVDGLRPEERPHASVRGDGLDVRAGPDRRGIAGTWEFSSLPPGRYEVRFYVSGAPILGQTTRVEAGKTTAVRFAFPGDRAVVGRVVSEDGSGVGRVTLWWVGGTRAVASTDDDGRFAFARLDPTPGTLVAQPLFSDIHSQKGGRAVVDGVIPGSSTPVQVVLARGATLVFRCPDLEPGREVGVEVYARYGTSLGRPAKVTDSRRLEVPLGVTGVPAEVFLRIRGAAPLRFETAALAAGEVRDLGVAHFDAGREVSVRVTLPEGSGVPRATVQPEDMQDSPVVTDAKGDATFPRMPTFSFAVGVEAPDHPPYVFEIPAGATSPLRLVLEPEGTLEVRVQERDGDPASGARVSLSMAPANPYDHESDALTREERAGEDGVWRGAAQPRGYRIHVRSLRGVGEADVTTAVRSGETSVVTVRLP